MSLLFTLSIPEGLQIPQSELANNPSRSITLDTVTLDSAAQDITNYSCTWYLIDKPDNSSASIILPNADGDRNVILSNIDVWGTYRIFCVVEDSINNSIKSEENPLKSRNDHFVDISVLSTNNQLEKPAYHQRNWKEKYDNLVGVVDNTNKKIKVVNTGTESFTLPVSDGSNGQFLKVRFIYLTQFY